MDNGLQLEMNFDRGINRFQNCLDNGVFSILVEMNAPALDTELDNAAAKLLAMDKTITGVGAYPVGLAITDKSPYPNSWNIVDFITKLPQERRDRHVVYLSGMGTSAKKIHDTLKICSSEGFFNIVPVSGNIYPKENERETRKRNFVECTTTLDLLKNKPINRIFPGCVVNPFKYTLDANFAQYYKLIRKLNAGASFVVTQMGWDLAKLQELRWYLSLRGLHYPVIARLCVLSPEKVEKIQNGEMPGIVIPSGMKKILDSECRFSYNQFEAAQWRRLQLHVAGCKLLGFTGVQIAGIDTPERFNIALRRINSAINEFETFPQWLQAYQEHIGQIDMSHYPYSFYMFDKLLSPPYPIQESPKMRHARDMKLGYWARSAHDLREFLFAHANEQAPNEHYTLKKLLAGCHGCSVCRLPQTMFICPEKCPKGLANGPCGGSRPNGSCELDASRECIHHRITRYAVWRNDVDLLEDGCIPQSPR